MLLADLALKKLITIIKHIECWKILLLLQVFAA